MQAHAPAYRIQYSVSVLRNGLDRIELNWIIHSLLNLSNLRNRDRNGDRKRDSVQIKPEEEEEVEKG